MYEFRKERTVEDEEIYRNAKRRKIEKCDYEADGYSTEPSEEESNQSWV